MSIVIGYVSDLHLEVCPRTAFDRINKIADHLCGVDVLVVAGDFSSDMPYLQGSRLNAQPLESRLYHLCERMGKTEVVFVPGNHEYYSSSFPVIDGKLLDMDKEVSNLHVLNNDVVTLKGQRFVGTTLWFPHRQYDVDMRLNDFNQIEDFSRSVEERGREASNFLVKAVQKGDVVVTHHLPTHDCVDPSKVGSTLNRFYVHNHGPLIEEVQPALWIHGHSHTPLDMMEGETRFLRNPYGYEMHEVNSHFDFGAFVEI